MGAVLRGGIIGGCGEVVRCCGVFRRVGGGITDVISVHPVGGDIEGRRKVVDVARGVVWVGVLGCCRLLRCVAVCCVGLRKIYRYKDVLSSPTARDYLTPVTSLPQHLQSGCRRCG